MTKKTALIVDDSIEILEVIMRNLVNSGFQTFQCTNVSDAVELLKNTHVDILITDLQMPGINGLQLIKYSNEKFPQIPILVITGNPSVSNAVEAGRLGAMDYLVKPFTREELLNRVNSILLNQPVEEPKQKKVRNIDKSTNPSLGIIGNSKKMKDLYGIIDRVKDLQVTVFINGESGTGKELVARAIHYSGQYSKSPFIAVNCGAIPENLLESELFGYVKGAFTGANETRAGFFQAADGGTIFLDEIGNASLNVQARLLRVIQEKEITMIGSSKAQKINVRIISATNSNLKKQCEIGTFREDLFYRLNVVNIDIPPLRDRKEDISDLINHFLTKFSKEFGQPVKLLDSDALQSLIDYNWPGNIRELENTIQRAVVLGNEIITSSDIPEHISKRSKTESYSSSDSVKTLKQVEKEHILNVLESVDHNKSKAAEILGIDRKTLRHKLND
jgi:two-component system response regulator HydG